MAASLAAAVAAGPGASAALAQVSAGVKASVASESPASRAIEIREGGLPLDLGDQGDLVAHVQKRLGVAADGIFGAQTDSAVRKFQLQARLTVDGIVGPATWGALFGQASGAGVGGANVPPEVKEHVERALAGASSAAGSGGRALGGGQATGGSQTEAGSQGTLGGSGDGTTGAAPESAPTQPVAGGGSCSSTLRSPVNGTQTSPFGPRGGRNHDGVDIAAPTGTAIRAAACGTVSLAGQQSGYGNMVCITHTSRFSTCYAHMSRFVVSNGQQVTQGQVIGYVGCTGSCTGPHLHFETRVDGQAQNPSTYLSGGAVPGATTTRTASASTRTASTSTGTSSSAPSSSTPTTVADYEATATGAGSADSGLEQGALATTTAQPPATAEPTAQLETTVAPEPVAAAEPVATEPVAPEPIAAEPVTAEPVVAEPVVAPEPVAVAPTADATVTAEAVVPEPVVAEPVAAAPEPVVTPEPVTTQATVAAEPVVAEAPSAGPATTAEATVQSDANASIGQ